VARILDRLTLGRGERSATGQAAAGSPPTRRGSSVAAAIALPRIPSFAPSASEPPLASVESWPTFELARESALSIPAVKTCRDLIVGAGAQMGIYKYRGVERVDPGTLLTQPDPDAALSATLAGTLEDLIYDGRAYWLVLARDGSTTERLPSGFPVRARWIPRGDVALELEPDAGSYSRLLGYRIPGIDALVSPDDVIRFDSPLGSVLARGAATLNNALELEAAAARMASIELPAGTLTNTGEQLSPAEAAEEVERFESARSNHTVAWLQNVEYSREQLTAEDLQLVEARANAATEIARLHNVPVSMVSASPSGGASAMLYANLGSTLTLFASSAVTPLLVALEQSLSGDTVTAHGQRVAFDIPTFLRSDPAELRAHVLELLAAEVIDTAEARQMLGLGPSAAPTLQPGGL
jgi:phage portal protein BeeE